MPYLFKERHRPPPWAQFRRLAKHRIFEPLLALEYVSHWTAYCLSRWAFLEVLEYCGSFSILIAVIFYFAESGQRTQARHYQAWQVINTAQGQSGSGGRIDALAQLNDDHVPLVGVNVEGAFLQGVRLERANLLRSNFHNADLRDAHLAGVNFDSAYLSGANLRGADLSGANLSGALFDDADFAGADFSGVQGWKEIGRINGANVESIRNAPPGFVQWAMQRGATAGDSSASTKPTTR